MGDDAGLARQRSAFLVGHPVGHSLSKLLHEAAYRALELPLSYVPFDVEPGTEADAFARLRSPDSIGGNVTMPYKHHAAAVADWRSDVVERCGAASTVVNNGGRLLAHATDVIGLRDAFAQRRRTISSGPTVIVGAGGAAAAALEALRVASPPSIVIAARRTEQARRLIDRMRRWLPCPVRDVPLDQLARLKSPPALLINATSIGMREGDRFPVDPGAFGSGTLVYDFVYRRDGLTSLHRAADAAACPYMDGARHLLTVTGPAIELLTQRTPPGDVIKETLVGAIGREPVDWGAD